MTKRVRSNFALLIKDHDMEVNMSTLFRLLSVVMLVVALMTAPVAAEMYVTTSVNSTVRARMKEEIGGPDDTGERTPGPSSESLSSDTVTKRGNAPSGKPDIPTSNNRTPEDKGVLPENHKWTNPVTGTVTSDKGQQGPRRQYEPQVVIKFRSLEPLGYRDIGNGVTLPYGYRRLKELVVDGEWFEYFKYDLINTTGYLGSQVETPTDTTILRDVAVVYQTHVANLRNFMNLGTILSHNDAMDDFRSKLGRGGRVKRAVEAYNALGRLPMWNFWRNAAIKHSGIFSDEPDGPLLLNIFVTPFGGDHSGAVAHYSPPTSVQDYMDEIGKSEPFSLAQTGGGDFQTDTGELLDAMITEAEYAVRWLNARSEQADGVHLNEDLRKLRVFTEALRLPMGLPDFRDGITVDPMTFYGRLVDSALRVKVDDATDDFLIDPLVLEDEEVFLRTSHRSLQEDDAWWIGMGDVYAAKAGSRALALSDLSMFGTVFPASTSWKGKVDIAEEIRTDRTVWYSHAGGWQDDVFYADADELPVLIHEVPDLKDNVRAQLLGLSFASVKGAEFHKMMDLTVSLGSKYEFIPTSVEDIAQGYWYVVGTALGYPVSKP